MGRPNPSVGHPGRLQRKDIRDLFEGHHLALVFPRFYPLTDAVTAATKIEREVARRVRSNRQSDKTSAMAFHEPNSLRRVFRGVTDPVLASLRALEGAWGSALRSHVGESDFADVMVFPKGAGSLPHCDRVEWDDPKLARPLGQASVLVYLRVPKRGGELEVWDFTPSKSAYQRLRGRGIYGLDRHKLRSPTAVIKPERGDMIILSTTRVHAVNPGSGPRIATTFFVTYHGPSRPLTACGSIPPPYRQRRAT